VFVAYLIDYEKAKHDGVEAHMRIGKSCGSNSSRPCTFDQFMREVYSNLGSYISNTQRKGPFLYDDPKYAKGPQDLDTTTKMARDLSALKLGLRRWTSTRCSTLVQGTPQSVHSFQWWTRYPVICKASRVLL
jgi:hypothetical protein